MTNKDIVKIMKGEFEEGKMELIANMIKETKSASGIIWNTFKELEEPEFIVISEHFGVPTFPIGQFHKYFPSSSSSLIEEDRSFVSCKQQTMVRIGGSTWFSLWLPMEWLESLPKGFIKEVGDRGCIIKWAPQQEVLSHQAIRDQQINAKYVTGVWRIGVMLDNEMGREEIGRAIKRVIIDKEGTKMR
ncbi:hypothetical protein Tco_1208888 [Tanacetum coccineum]